VSKRDKDEVKAILNFKNEKAPYKLQSLNFNQVPLSQKKKKTKKKNTTQVTLATANCIIL